MEDDNQTLEANPGVDDVATAEGSQNDDSAQTASTPEALSLDDINTLTGHRYDSIDKAREGLVNMKKAIGKKEIVKEVVPGSLVAEVQSLKAQVAEASFYTEHPDLKPHREILSKFGNPYDAIKDPVVQKVVEAVKAREESETLKSNSRIAQVSSDYQTDFSEAERTGNWIPFLEKHKGVGIPK